MVCFFKQLVIVLFMFPCLNLNNVQFCMNFFITMFIAGPYRWLILIFTSGFDRRPFQSMKHFQDFSFETLPLAFQVIIHVNGKKI